MNNFKKTSNNLLKFFLSASMIAIGYSDRNNTARAEEISHTSTEAIVSGLSLEVSGLDLGIDQEKMSFGEHSDQGFTGLDRRPEIENRDKIEGYDENQFEPKNKKLETIKQEESNQRYQEHNAKVENFTEPIEKTNFFALTGTGSNQHEESEQTAKISEDSGSLTALPSLYNRVFYALGGLSALALAIVVISRRIRQNAKVVGKLSKPLELISTLAIAPKRQILLIKIRDTEIAVASTEHGINFLSELASKNKLPQSTYAEEPLRSLPQLVNSYDQDSTTRPKLNQRHPESIQSTKSDILRKALESIDSRKLRSTPKQDADSHTSLSSLDVKPKNAADLNGDEKLTSTLAKQKRPLKKMFSNSYKEHAALGEGQDTNAVRGRNTDDGEIGEHADNVAQLIREKLKQMKTIG